MEQCADRQALIDYLIEELGRRGYHAYPSIGDGDVMVLEQTRVCIIYIEEGALRLEPLQCRAPHAYPCWFELAHPDCIELALARIIELLR